MTIFFKTHSQSHTLTLNLFFHTNSGGVGAPLLTEEGALYPQAPLPPPNDKSWVIIFN